MDNFKLSFSRNGEFDEQRDDSFSVGDTIYLQIQWDHGILDRDFPVRFFVDSCRVSENTKGLFLFGLFSTYSFYLLSILILKTYPLREKMGSIGTNRMW